MGRPMKLARFLVLDELDAVPLRNRPARSVIGDDHGPAQFGDGEEALGEFIGKMDAAVRGWIARNIPRVQSHSSPGESLAEGHRGVVVGRGMMISVLLQDVKDSGGRLVALSTRRHQATPDLDSVAVDSGSLRLQVDRYDHRPRGGQGGIPGERGGIELAIFRGES